MSSYIFKAKNKETGEVKVVSAIDDHFGSHRYGYFIENNVALTGEQFNQYWERIEVTSEKETLTLCLDCGCPLNADVCKGECMCHHSETPTPKTVEEVVAEWDELIKVATKFELRTWLCQTLLARDAAYESKLREVVGELFAVMDYQNTERELNAEEYERMGIKLALQGFKLKFTAKHGITNL